MTRIFVWIGCAFLFGLPLVVAADKLAEQRKPVVVELFTSEGCSSCPPADLLLAWLDRMQPIPGAQIVVLSEHVDYWNHLGWADPYSSHAFSSRQEQYARRFGIEALYTPQMVVDGRSEFVGTDKRAAESAIRSALKQPNTAIHLAETNGKVEVEIAPLPTGKAGVFAAYAADAGTQDVARGENQGRRLFHVAIVKTLREIGSIDAHSPFHTELPVESGSRLVVFVQVAGNGPILGAAIRPVK